MGKRLSKQKVRGLRENHFEFLPIEVFFFLCDFLQDKDILNFAKCSKNSNLKVSQYLQSKVTDSKVKALERIKEHFHTLGEKELFRRCGNSNSSTLLFLRTTSLLDGSQMIRRDLCSIENFTFCLSNHQDQKLRRPNILLSNTNKLIFEKVFDLKGMSFPGFFKFSLYMKLHENFNWPHTEDLKSTFSISIRNPKNFSYTDQLIIKLDTFWWRKLEKEKDDFITGDVKVVRDLGGWMHVIPFFDKPIFLQKPEFVKVALIDKNFQFKKGGIIFDHWQVVKVTENDYISKNHYKL